MRHVNRAFRAAFPHTLPILAGFLFLGFAYGLLMRTKGFSFLYPMCMAMTIFGGSLEYITVSMLLSAFAPLETFLMALLIQARHLFYGLSLLGKYAGKVLTYDFIIRELWGPKAKTDNQILRVNMANIRRKIEPTPGNPQYIFTEVGVGYRMREGD